MLDDMTNTSLIENVKHNPEATEKELELAYRLEHAIDEIMQMERDMTLITEAAARPEDV